VTGEEPPHLYRFGTSVETPEDLESACEDALRRGFPHGVSVVSETRRVDASVATRADVELYFPVEKTGRRHSHYTVVLPHPVTERDAERLNRAFGRLGQ